MSMQSFDELLENIRNSISGFDTLMRTSMNPKEKLVITFEVSIQNNNDCNISVLYILF